MLLKKSEVDKMLPRSLNQISAKRSKNGERERERERERGRERRGGEGGEGETGVKKRNHRIY